MALTRSSDPDGHPENRTRSVGGAAAAGYARRHHDRRPHRRADPRELLAVFLGGALGCGLRALLATAFPVGDGSWPWPTFAANIAGALLLGYATTRLQERLPVTAYRRPFIGTGLCGGLTTFSTMQLEIVLMIDGGHLALAAGYAAASVVGGLLAVHLATAAARRSLVRA